MQLSSEKIIIFKTDRVGDLINFSPCLKIIKDNKKKSHITLACSQYNYQIAKNYKYVDKYIILDKENIARTIINNFRVFFITKYKYLFQLDGRNNSYLISCFIRAHFKSTICFEKYKKILNFTYQINRPLKIFMNLFFNNVVFCDERYSNLKKNKFSVHYQSLYFCLLKKLNFKLTDKKNICFLDANFKNIYNSFYKNHIKKKFYLFHFDEKWDMYNQRDRQNILQIIKKASLKNNIIITSGKNNFLFLETLKKRFNTYNYKNNKFSFKNKKFTSNKIILLTNIPLNLLAYFVKNSIKNISSHAGSVVHMSAAFKKQIVDIIKKKKNNEYDRWIPLISNYKRINFHKIDNKYLKNLKL